MSFQPDAVAEQLLARLRARGFDQAQASVGETRRCELNLAHNQPSLMRSTESRRAAASGIVGGRKASAEGTDLSQAGLATLVDELWAAAASAPVDEAHAVSAGQTLSWVQGPPEADPSALAQALRTLLDWRAAHTPTVMIEEGYAAHVRSRSHLVTSGGSSIGRDLGCCELSVFGLAREGGATSSFNYAGGTAHALAEVPQAFGVARMMQDLTRQVHTRALGERFVGEVVLAPDAVSDLIGWLMQQLTDGPLIDGSSLFRHRVGELVASPLLTLASRFDGPGCAPVSGDAFIAPATTLLESGRLTQLTPSLYGSRKTGLAHRPVAATGWELKGGSTPLEALIAAVPRGALVDRLSMGDPAPNGDFSGVVKNSFLIEGGRVGGALAETMVSGNVAQMLKDVLAVSAERIDSGTLALPWLRIGGLHFS